VPTETVFDGLAGLAKLPWFTRTDEGRLAAKGRTYGPVLDMHSHLALAYVLPMRLDLQRASDETEHYLPACCRLDLDVYVNRNFTPDALSAMKRDLTLGSLTRGGMRRTHTVPNIVREMDELGIARSVILPIDFPVLSDNAGAALGAVRATEKLIAFGSVHPYARGVAKRLDEQLARGARGIKVHPAVQCIRPDDPKAMKLYRLCAQRELPILWHCGPVDIETRYGRYCSQVKWYERPIAENPRTTFVLGHSGALQMEQALALQRRYPNVWLETSSQSVTNVRTIVTQADTSRVVYGSDWPFYHQGIALAKVLLATEGREEARRAVLWGNAARLLGVKD
jgi:predicted TIM-barrel fold metal-dependent hydrolase